MPTSPAAQTLNRPVAAATPRGKGHAAKRVLDLVLAALMLMALAPLLLLVYAAVRLTSAGPALFVQPRVGRDGFLFDAFKFRTMAVDAEERLAAHLRAEPQAAEEYRIYRKLRRDPRVTAIGGFLRRYSLDELPQLLNVLKGDMSLVGPRCYLPRELPEMGKRAAVILSVLPGITGLWQVSGRNGTTFAERLDYDVRYVRGWSLGLDLRILAKTALVVLTARDAY